MVKHLAILISTLIFQSCQAQDKTTATNKIVGGPCEGCDAIHEYGEEVLTSVDTLPLYDQTDPKLKITGTVFHKDGATPAKDVILYIYHTNRDGIYQTRGDETGWAKRHGFIRGWIKTDATGMYTFYTFRPGAYPNRRAAEHIHITIKEPDKNEYYMEDFLFDDDPLLTKTERDRLRQRGGSGIVMPKSDGANYLVERDIILGLNIPDYE